MFIPQNFKYKKTFRPRIKQKVYSYSKNVNMSYGDFGFKSLESGWLNSKNLETIRKILNKQLKKTGSFVVKIFPNYTITKKPLEVRMGKGKGNVDTWVFPIKIGTIFIELKGIPYSKAVELFQTCQIKLPIKIKLIINDAIYKE
jgi:large subunit ribosomal protein L16